MIKKKLYPGPSLPPYEACDKCYSHYRKYWHKESGDFHFNITDGDGAMMAREVTLPSIELVLEMMASDSLPSLDKIKECIARPGQVCLDAHIPHSASDRRSVNFSDKNVEVSTDIGLTAGLSTEELDDVNNLDDEFIEDDTGPQSKKITIPTMQ